MCGLTFRDGEMELYFTDENFYRKIQQEWFQVNFECFLEALRLMGIKDGKYVVEEQEEDQTHVKMSIFSHESRYTLKIHRVDLLNPYPCWWLKANNEQLWRSYIVKMKVNVAFDCVLTDSGAIVD